MGKKKEVENYAETLEREFAHWDHLYEHGCTDPFWPDGVNLNLIRNHIFYYKRKIEETMDPAHYPEIYHRTNPPEVDGDYVARADEIRGAAAQALEAYKMDKNCRFLRQQYDFITPKDRETISLDNVLGYLKSLEHAIRDDDLVSMRRHRNPEGYLSAFASCAEKVSEIPVTYKKQAVQMTLF